MNMNEKNKIENCRIEPKLKLINMDSVEVEQVEWLLYPFIPYGKVTIIQGDPGEGKTTMVLQIIAKLTRGEPILPVTDKTKTKEKRSDEVDSENEDLDAEDNMQEQSSVSPVNVIYQTAEDGLGDTIKPRLLAAGADCSKVLVIDDSDQPLTMADVRLEEAIVQTKAKMVVLDPIQGFLGADVDMHRANEIRPLMKRIAVLSEKYHCAVILIGHMNKNSNGKSSYRGLGSIDFQAAARSVLIVGRVKDEPEVRVVCHTKSSLAPEGTSIAFRLDKNNGFEWIGEYDISADELLNGDGRGQKSRKAKEFLLGTEAGDLAVNVLDEYVKDFQKRNPTLRVFSCYLHQDEATPHLHIDFVPYVTNWKGKGMDTRVSLKQALKSLGFQGGNKHDTELNQWINHEKEVLAETAKQYGIEWEQKGTHEEHLDVYNFKKKERKKEVQELEQEKEHLTAEKEELTAQIAESRADIQNLKDDKEQAIKAKQEAEQKAGSAEKELKSLEDRREQLQPIMDSVSKEIKEYGTVKMLLPEAGTLERAVTYRDKKIKPLFLQIKNKVAVMAAQVKELTKEVEGWKRKYQKVKQKYNAIQRELDDIRKDNQKLSEEKDILQGVSDRYDRVVRVLGIETVDTAVQQDIQNEKVLEEKRRMEQMPKGNIHERLAWGMKKSEMENQQRKKTKSKNREMER